MVHQLRYGLLLLPLFVVGCPDSEARFNEFLDATKDDRMDAGEGDTASESTSEDTGVVDGVPDMTGIYLLALETSLVADSPLQFVTTVDMTVDADGMGATATFTFQPLSLGVGSLLEPREFVGIPLTFEDIAFDAGGNFEIDMGVVMVTGMANPITGSDITASLVLSGRIIHINALCGDITGEVTSPIQSDLVGSNFGMLRLDDDGSDPATLPTMFPYQCDQVPPAPDGGTDTGTDTGTDSTT